MPSDVPVIYNPLEKNTGQLIESAVQKTQSLLEGKWGLEPPQDCAVYLMNSWLQFAFQSAPWRRKAMLLIFFPLWAPNARRLWSLTGGWMMRHGERKAVGVKPPRLIRRGRSDIGERIFLPEANETETLERIVSHELTHAFTADLSLPVWLYEGLAMVATDAFFGRPTVRPETADEIAGTLAVMQQMGAQVLNLDDAEATARLYLRAYWITRYLDEAHPQVLRDMLSQRLPTYGYEDRLASALGMERALLWKELGEKISAWDWKQGASSSVEA
jgi:hypothetical protein